MMTAANPITNAVDSCILPSARKDAVAELEELTGAKGKFKL